MHDSSIACQYSQPSKADRLATKLYVIDYLSVARLIKERYIMFSCLLGQLALSLLMTIAALKGNQCLMSTCYSMAITEALYLSIVVKIVTEISIEIERDQCHKVSYII